MSDVVTFPSPPSAPSIVGPERRGHAVIVEGRAIPKLHCHERGEEVELILDERFSLSLPKAMAHQIASFVANALAIGAGYSHSGASTKDRPFAPEVASGYWLVS